MEQYKKTFIEYIGLRKIINDHRRALSYNDLFKLFEKKEFEENVLTKEQKEEIDKFYEKNYGKKIPYIWHNLFTKYSGKFDVRYIPIDIFLQITEVLNGIGDTLDILKDKNFLYNITKFVGLKAPERYFYSIKNVFFDAGNNIISKDDFFDKVSDIGEVFIKPTSFSGYAKKCRILNIINGIDIYSKSNIKDIINKDYNIDFVIQKRIYCHKSISDIYSKSVNTFSVISLILNNEIKIIKPCLKIGMGGNMIDWGGFKHKGLVIPIKEDGTLYDYAFCPNERKKYFSHPDTGIVFKNYKIDLYPKVLETVRKLHPAIPWLKFCSWDLTIDEHGEIIVIETEKPSALIKQMIYGEGFFGEDTEHLLSFLK